MFQAIKTTRIHETIAEAYAPGGAHIDKYLNVAGSGLDNCIKDQVESLAKQPSIQFYRVEEGDTFVGYFGEEKDGFWMSTIFISEKYRPRKKEFWQVVQSKMQPKFMCGGFLKNEPACNFYKKMGGKVIATVETEAGPGLYFEFSKD